MKKLKRKRKRKVKQKKVKIIGTPMRRPVDINPAHLLIEELERRKTTTF